MGHIFISYSHKDRDYVHRLQDALQAAGFDAWIDDRIDYGTKWPKVLQEQLDACDAFIVVVSENSYESEWVQNEVARAKRKGKPFFPLLLNGEPWLSVEVTQYVDVTDGSLPTQRFYERLAIAVPRKQKRPRKTSRKSSAKELFNEGLTLNLQGQAERALQKFKQAKEIDPFYPGVDLEIQNIEKERAKGYIDQQGRVTLGNIKPRRLNRSELWIGTITLVGCVALFLLVPRAVMYLSGVTSTPPLTDVPGIQPEIESGGPCELRPGESIPLAVSGVSGEGITYSWAATSGQLTPSDRPAVAFTASHEEGPVIIRVVVQQDGRMSEATITCRVVMPPPTPTPTFTPVPSPTLWACTSNRPEKIRDANIPGEITIDYPEQGTTDIPSGGSIRVAGTYTGIPEGSYLWVFVYSPSAGLRGRYYPQTRDALQGWQPEPIAQNSGSWSANVVLATPRTCYEVIVMVADAPASQSIAEQLQTWAQRNDFPGYELNGPLTAVPPAGPGFPEGLVEKANVEFRTR